ncbi:MAG: hypothetical protein FJ296_00855 [Planctomycetes bacterium]|nr:hypothetical protein [Planctomycetota bacterium]
MRPQAVQSQARVRPWAADGDGRRAFHGEDARLHADPEWKDHLLFHEDFHAETGRGLGASHQTGWTALAASLVEAVAKDGPGRARQGSRGRRSAVTVP